MPVIRSNRKEDKLVGQVRIEVSLAFELVMAIQRCCLPNLESDEQEKKWISRVRRQLSKQTIHTLDQLSFILPIAMVLKTPAPRTIEAFLALLEAIPAEEFLDRLQNEHTLDEDTLAMVSKLRRGEELSEAESVSLETLLGSKSRAQLVIETAPLWTNSVYLKQQLLPALSDFYTSYLQAEIEQVRTILETSASQARSLLNSRLLPTEQLIEGLTHGFTLSQESAYTYVVLCPSFYGAPYVQNEELKDGGLLLLYPARPDGMLLDRTYLDHERLMQRLKCLADSTRLEILRLLAQRPYNTQELTEALHRSQPTISHHMSELRVAGLVRGELQANTRLYSLYPDFIDQLAQELKMVLKLED